MYLPISSAKIIRRFVVSFPCFRTFFDEYTSRYHVVSKVMTVERPNDYLQPFSFQTVDNGFAISLLQAAFGCVLIH